MVHKAVLQPTEPRRFLEVLDFYRSNPHGFLLPRPDGDFAAAIKRGQHFIVQEAGSIRAASGVFEYEPNLPFVELSETRVLDVLQGFGLQRVFLRLRIASVVVFQGPDVVITTAIDPRNHQSTRNVAAHGFVPWASPVAPAFASCPDCPNKPRNVARRCCCDFYELPGDGARVAVQDLLAQTENGVIQLNRRGDLLALECSDCRVVTDPELRAALADFAQGGSW